MSYGIEVPGDQECMYKKSSGMQQKHPLPSRQAACAVFVLRVLLSSLFSFNLFLVSQDLPTPILIHVIDVHCHPPDSIP